MNRAISGGTWIILSSIVISIGGFILWLVTGMFGGAKAVGYATTAFSIATLLATLGNPGLNYAVLREVPLKGSRAYIAALTIALVTGIVLSLGSLLFINIYEEFNLYVIASMLLTIIILVNAVNTATIVALLKTKYLFIANTASTIVKVCLGVTLVLIGLAGLGATIALLASTITVLVATTIVISTSMNIIRPLKRDLREVLTIGFSNYPQQLSIQLIVSAGIVLLALLTNNPTETGTFYIALMITLVLATIPRSIITVSLPLTMKTGEKQLASQGLRIGCSLILPIAIALTLLSKQVLALINQEFAQGELTLIVLLYSIIPNQTILASITKLNAEKKLKEITIIGAIRLTTLTILTILLTPRLGALGAALAYLASTITPQPLILREVNYKDTLKLISIQAALTIPILLVKANTIPIAITVALTSTILLHLTKTLSLNEAKTTIKTIIRTLKP